jgi:hypothetical protein
VAVDAQQQQTIIERFINDAAFRKRALEDPNKAVKEEFGIDLPLPMRVASDGSTYWLEPAPVSENAELSDEQLELAAGGNQKPGGGGHGGPAPGPQHFPQQFRIPISGGGIVGGCGGN